MVDWAISIILVSHISATCWLARRLGLLFRLLLGKQLRYLALGTGKHCLARRQLSFNLGFLRIYSAQEFLLTHPGTVEVVPRLLCLNLQSVSYTHLRAHETVLDLVCRLLLEKK